MDSEKSSFASQESSEDVNNWNLISGEEESSDPAVSYNDFIMSYKPEIGERIKKKF